MMPFTAAGSDESCRAAFPLITSTASMFSRMIVASRLAGFCTPSTNNSPVKAVFDVMEPR